MRSRAAQFVCLLLLLSSLAGTDARADRLERTRTPGGTFVRNLVLQAAVEEPNPVATRFRGEGAHEVVFAAQNGRGDVFAVYGSAMQAARTHAVTGNSL